MSHTVLGIGLIVLFFILAAGVILYLRQESGGSLKVQGRPGGFSEGKKRAAQAGADILNSAKHATGDKNRNDSALSLRKRLKYAQWDLSPTGFLAAQAAVSIFVMGLCSVKLNALLVIISGLSGPILLNAILTWRVDRRFKAFDSDYPQFLMSVVGLLKTGMNPIQGLETAARGLPGESLLRSEVEMMIERLRFGVPEDKSIGAFGEDIYHPENELFVQALLLSRRVGGTLSDTLERLAKQVRRRQFFRSSAVAAVGLQRGSIWFIVAILFGLEAYIYFMYPEMVSVALKDEVGWQVYQFGALFIIAGMLWVRQVSKFKI